MEQIIRDVEAAHELRHPQRAMQVLLECGHLRLMPWNVTVTGVGSQTSCGICPGDGRWYQSRLVVGIAETGVLWSSSMELKSPEAK